MKVRLFSKFAEETRYVTHTPASMALNCS